jgi:hypothetical protein
MVVTTAMEPGASVGCVGVAWLDLHTGQARLQLRPQAEVEMVPWIIYDIPNACSAVLLSAPPVVGDMLVFSGASVHMVQCWLMRFFGPQATPQSMRASQVDFGDGIPTADLVSDVVIRAGQRLSLLGHGGTVRVAKWQVQVRHGGALEIVRLGVAESVMSSAIVVEGDASFANSTFIDCSARLNAVSEHGLDSRGGAISVIGQGRLKMQHCSMRRNTVHGGGECTGGALLISESSSAELVGTELSGNIAIGSRTAAHGGAIHVRDNSRLRLEQSTLLRNVADGSNCTFYVFAGAVSLDDNSVAAVSESEIAENVAKAALSDTCGGAFYATSSRLVLATSRINRNVADCGFGRNAANGGFGGAIYLSSSAAQIVGCELVENVAYGGAYANAGTGRYVPLRPPAAHCAAAL